MQLVRAVAPRRYIFNSIRHHMSRRVIHHLSYVLTVHRDASSGFRCDFERQRKRGRVERETLEHTPDVASSIMAQAVAAKDSMHCQAKGAAPHRTTRHGTCVHSTRGRDWWTVTDRDGGTGTGTEAGMSVQALQHATPS